MGIERTATATACMHAGVAGGYLAVDANAAIPLQLSPVQSFELSIRRVQRIL